MDSGTVLETIHVAAYTVPTDGPESDGTLAWDATTIVVVEARAGNVTGMGYTYGSSAVAVVVHEELVDVVVGRDVMDVGGSWEAMGAALRNVGRPGVGFMAVSAVDIALWDLKARVLDMPLIDLLPRFRDNVPVYGSGGFCSLSDDRLAEQLAGWVERGIPRVKMKISRDPHRDPERLDAARKGIGHEAQLFVDANGGLTRKQALDWAHRLRSEWDVSWFEEPVSSADVEGLRLVRDRGPGGLDVAAGEYAFVPADFRSLLDAVDCLQADVTRCGGITGLLHAGGTAAAHALELSGHCAPQVSAHALCGVERLRHLEYFHDHVRVESLLFDGVLEPQDGVLRPDRSRPGLGLELKRSDAAPYRVR
ncbi:MAG: enolase C-terminal domain-like protein [Actinomycetota bacterium]